MGTILDDGTGPGGTDDDRPTYTVNDVYPQRGRRDADVHGHPGRGHEPALHGELRHGQGDGDQWGRLHRHLGVALLAPGTGARTQTVTVPITNDGVYEGSEAFFLNLSGATNATISDSQGVGTIFDDGTGGGGTDDDRPTYTVDDVTRNEAAGTITFTVTLTGDTNLPSSVNFATASGTATSGADFTATSGTLNFPAGTGARTQTVTVPITNDSIYEKSEAFFLNLSGATNATISDPQGVGTILDDGTGPGGTDDDRPRYTVNDVTRNESAGTMTFTVTLTGNTALPSSVQFATASGSAGAGDFTGVSGTLNFPAGSGARTQTVTVPLTNDNVAEPTEQFFLNLSNPTEAIIADGQGVGTILDDDASVTAVKSAALYTDADGTGDVSPGDTLRYTIVVTNTSANAANAVQLTDLLPDVDLALVVGSVTTTRGTVASGNSAGSTTVVVNVGTLAAGATATVQFRARVANPLVGGDTQVANQAAVTGSNLVTTPTDDPATAPTGDPTVVPINLPARLSGSVYRDNGDGTFGAGDTGISAVTLTLTGTTAGGTPITRTAVTAANGSYTFLVPASNAGGTRSPRPSRPCTRTGRSTSAR
ncbi:MAG: Calx-beta domain-containing protein [Gemmataceae bacterium]